MGFLLFVFWVIDMTMTFYSHLTQTSLKLWLFLSDHSASIAKNHTNFSEIIQIKEEVSSINEIHFCSLLYKCVIQIFKLLSLNVSAIYPLSFIQQMVFPFIFWADVLHSLYFYYAVMWNIGLILLLVGRYTWKLDLARPLQLKQESLTSTK